MKPLRLSIWLTLYYTSITAVILGLRMVYPGIDIYLPIGGAQELLSGSTTSDPLESLAIYATQIQNFSDSLIWLVFAILGAVATVFPVTRVYMEIRNLDEYDQSLIETILILPIAVTSVVVIVQNSLALAFSLAGVVGAVRFRNTLKSSGDALYILLAIGVGLAAGIGALEIAIIMSVIFNYCFLLVWTFDYGARANTHRYMRDNQEELSSKHKHKRKNKEK
jgi:hypothetical protein